ncbi:MAG: sensor histidine kinase [Anaerolineae bacterium]|jgi:signal transduction histidine kinase|nr:sensor histidine kinase [Anaerolineae bacterium]
MKRSLDANIIPIFRWFVALEMIALSVVPIVEFYLFGQFSFINDPFFTLLFQSVLLFVYLSFPQIQYRLKQFYLPIGILIAVVYPSFINLGFVLTRMATGQPIDTMHVWALLPLLMIPLVPMAWQYDFKATLILFGGFGLIEMMIVLWARQVVDVAVLEFMYATFIRVITLLLVAFMIEQLVSVQQAQRDQLRQVNLKLTRQALVMEEIATIEERNRIARELHDTLAHTLSGLAVQLEAIKTVTVGDEETQVMVDRALTNTRDGLNETRNVLKNLRAAPIQELGFEQAMYHLVEGMQPENSSMIELFISRSIPMLTKELEHTIYRIVQESIKNALQHAHAKSIKVSIDMSQHTMRVVVTDDGEGFDLKKRTTHRGYGLFGLTERAEMVGGKLDVRSTESEGTTITFEVEL